MSFSDEGFLQDEDDDIPWADPSIRKDYEASLGRLILARNSLDLRLTQLIQCCLRRLGGRDVLKKLSSGNFSQRLQNLAMLESLPLDLGLASIDFDAVFELNRLRNIVAHGHFEQNPHMGDYELITNKARHNEFSSLRLDQITAELEEFAGSIGARVAFYDFSVIED